MREIVEGQFQALGGLTCSDWKLRVSVAGKTVELGYLDCWTFLSHCLLLFGFRSYSGNIACSSRCIDGEYVLVILARWRSSKSLGAPYKPIPGVFGDVELYCL